jgi:hypothetical protein
MDGVGLPGRELRIMMLSALSAAAAPFVFVSIIVLRKATQRAHLKARFWNKRMQHEIARWS